MRGVKYNLFFQTKNGVELEFPELKMNDLLSTLESLLKENYDMNERISNQTIYNLQNRPKNASRLLRLFVRIEKAIN